MTEAEKNGGGGEDDPMTEAGAGEAASTVSFEQKIYEKLNNNSTYAKENLITDPKSVI